MRSAKLVLCELGPANEPGLESYSPFCLKIHRALRLAGLAYESRVGRMPSDFSNLNPTGQVPVLLVDGEPIHDSTVILETIARLAPGVLLPADPRARAEAWLWEDWADRALSGYVVAARWADHRNWPTVRDVFFGGAPWLVRKLVAPRLRARIVETLVARDFLRAGMEALHRDYARVLDHLEARAPRTGFWLGDRPTVADVALFAQLRQLRSGLLTPAQEREIAIRPNLDDWMDRVDAATRGKVGMRLVAAA